MPCLPSQNLGNPVVINNQHRRITRPPIPLMNRESSSCNQNLYINTFFVDY